jgi:plastocyanin
MCSRLVVSGALWVLGAGTLPECLFAAELGGRVEIVERDGKTVPGVGAVVWLPGVPAPPTPKSPPTVASKDKRFEPHVVAVARGATVVFPNLDKILHNVFSRTPGAEFDLGLYHQGKSKDVRFTAPGLVRIYCNIHSQMAGYIMVLDSADFAVVNDNGFYRLEGVPEGRRELRVWHERAGETGVMVQVVSGVPTTLNLTLDASSYKEVPHRNKYGEEYPPVRRDDDRY